jgi:hypothetical protein
MIPETTPTEVLQKLVAAVKGIFVTSTDGIVGQLNRTIKRLEKHSKALDVKSNDLYDASNVLRAESMRMDTEAERAQRIAKNLGKLLGS